MRKSILFNLILILWCSGYSVFGQIQNPKARWKFKTEGTIRGAAATDADQLYFGSADGNLYCVNKLTGELTWKYQTQGSVSATPVVTSSAVVFTSRDNFVYAINAKSGQLIWKFQMQPIMDGYWEWEYFTSTPVQDGNKLYVGSGDGNLYALSLKDGKQIWKFKTDGRIRATPLVTNGTIYQPSNDGIVYALNSNDGKLQWKFETDGSKLDSRKFGFDRTCIFARPQLVDSTLIVAARDGKTYGVDIFSHQEKWRFTYGPTWAMSTTLEAGTVYVGWSTNNIVCALDAKKGTEKWKFVSGGVMYTSPLVTATDVVMGSGDEKVYSLDKKNGQKKWEYKTGGKVFSSVIKDGDVLYFGSDDGYMYALEEGAKPYKAVYYPVPHPKFDFTVDRKITPYLKDRGFEQLDSARLYRFLTDRIRDQSPSVIVFAYDYIPPNMVGDNPGQGMIRKYLESGGRILWFGNIPNLYYIDASGKPAINIDTPNKLLSVTYNRIEESGNYYTKTTQAGLNLGLPPWFTATYANVASEGITPLGIDENGRVTAWMKKFNPRPGSAFVSCRTWAWYAPLHDSELELIHRMALHELE